jgi:hypothetical protein
MGNFYIANFRAISLVAPCLPFPDSLETDERPSSVARLVVGALLFYRQVSRSIRSLACRIYVVGRIAPATI